MKTFLPFPPLLYSLFKQGVKKKEKEGMIKEEKKLAS